MSRPALLYFLAFTLWLVSTGPSMAQAPYGFHHVTTREPASHVIYDPFHNRFYGSVPGENAVYVIDEVSGSLIQKISVPSAYGLDLSTDGTRLYASSNVTILGYAAAQMIFAIDTTTLHIVDIVRPTVSLGQSVNGLPPSSIYLNENLPATLASLSNGKLAYATFAIGTTGGAVFLYDPSTGLSTPIVPINYYSGSLSKAGSGNGFVAVSSDSEGEQVSIYDAASESYVSNVRFTTTNNADVAMSPDGSMVLLGGHILCDRALNQIADLAGTGQPTSLAWTSQGSSFSSDGTEIYVASSLSATTSISGGGTVSYNNPVVYVFSSATHQLLHTVPLPEGSPAFQSGYSGMAVGSGGKAMVIDNAGFLEFDSTKAPATLSGTYSQVFSSNVGISRTMSPDGGTATTTQPTTINGSGFRSGATAYFGQTAASTTYVSANVLNVQPPAGTPGIVDVSVLFPDGWALLQSQAYSYGPVVTSESETAGSSDGGTTVTLTGNGFDVSSGYPTVLVGGRTATVTKATPTSVSFTTPAGTLGPADIELTSLFGTTTVPGGFTYVGQQVIPSLLVNQMLVDNARNQIYVADGNTGNLFVVDASTLSARVLFTPPNGGITTIAMTPDGSELLAANAYSGTIDIIDLTTGKDVKTIVPTPGNQPGTLYPNELVTTARGTAVVGLINPDLFDGGELVEVDLSTGATTLINGNMFAGIVLSSSADGSVVYVAQSSADGSSGAPPQLWSAASDGFLKQSVVGEYGPAELSTTDLGDRVYDGCYTLDQLDTWLRFATTCEPDLQLSNRVYGSTIHSSGALGYIPTANGVEIVDIHHGQTLLSIGDANGSLEGFANLAVNHDGSRLYVAEPNGIGVFTLPEVPLSIGSLTPATGSAEGGQTVVLRGSGFVPGTTVNVDGNSAGVQFVDSTQLTVTMPAVTAAKDIVSVRNPDNSSYSLDAAWDASLVTVSVPTLASISPVQTYTGGTVFFTVNGSGFVPNSVAFLDGVAGETQFINTNQIGVTFGNLPGPGTQLVTVKNPPSTTPSNALPVKTYDAAPYLNSLSPASIPAGSESFELTAFCNVILAPGSFVQWNGTSLSSQLIDSNHLVAQVPASLIKSQGTATITVSTPQATPSVSNPQTFTITPSIAAMSFSTSSVVLGPILDGSTATGAFTITSIGAIPLIISKLSMPDANFSLSGCLTTLNQGQSCTATVTYSPANHSGFQGEGGLVTVTSNAASQPSLNIGGYSGELVFRPDSTQLSVTAGKSVSDSVSVTSYGYIPKLTAQIACSGVPANATCTINPNSFSMPATVIGNNSSANFTITLATQAPVSGSVRGLYLAPGMMSMAAMLLLFRAPRRKPSVWLACLCICSLFGMSDCSSGASQTPIGGSGGTTSGGGGGSRVGGTPAGTYTVTITTTVPGMAPQTQALSLTVQ